MKTSSTSPRMTPGMAIFTSTFGHISFGLISLEMIVDTFSIRPLGTSSSMTFFIVSDISCLGPESIQVCRLHEERPSVARKAPFQAKNQVSGRNYVVNGPDSSIKADRRTTGNRG
jgi:hypothetical protein